jgi:hypothetical protein
MHVSIALKTKFSKLAQQESTLTKVGVCAEPGNATVLRPCHWCFQLKAKLHLLTILPATTWRQYRRYFLADAWTKEGLPCCVVLSHDWRQDNLVMPAEPAVGRVRQVLFLPRRQTRAKGCCESKPRPRKDAEHRDWTECESESRAACPARVILRWKPCADCSSSTDPQRRHGARQPPSWQSLRDDNEPHIPEVPVGASNGCCLRGTHPNYHAEHTRKNGDVVEKYCCSRFDRYESWDLLQWNVDSHSKPSSKLVMALARWNDENPLWQSHPFRHCIPSCDTIEDGHGGSAVQSFEK